MNNNDVTGIVLAGGKSSRMGTDKSLLQWNGKPLIEYAITVLKPYCNKVIISSNASLYDFTGCETWPDIITVEAAMAGIYSCLKRSETELNFVLSCDMPLVNPALISYLLQHSDECHIAAPYHHTNQIEPLCTLYKKSVLPDLEKAVLNENYSMLGFLKTCYLKLVHIHVNLPFYSDNLFLNINSPGDLEILTQPGNT